jgi:hypothetical protein
MGGRRNAQCCKEQAGTGLTGSVPPSPLFTRNKATQNVPASIDVPAAPCPPYHTGDAICCHRERSHSPGSGSGWLVTEYRLELQPVLCVTGTAALDRTALGTVIHAITGRCLIRCPRDQAIERTDLRASY